MFCLVVYSMYASLSTLSVEIHSIGKIFFVSIRILCKIHWEITSVFHVRLRNLYWCVLLLERKVVIFLVFPYFVFLCYIYLFSSTMLVFNSPQAIHTFLRCWDFMKIFVSRCFVMLHTIVGDFRCTKKLNFLVT